MIARRCQLGLLAVMTLAIAAAMAGARRAPGPQEMALASPPTAATPYVFGASMCRSCHADPTQATELCRMIEYQIWNESDPHKIAMDWGQKDDPSTHRTEAARRAWAMGDQLEIADVTRAPECVGCHSVIMAQETPKQGFNPTAEGVSCVACHGAYRNWVLNHQAVEDPRWKSLSREEKWLEEGMADLWDPVSRAETCMSCHVGDPDPGRHRNLTHAMYAAGHPPLPSIEVAAFAEEQPRHWQYLRQKPESAQQRLGFDGTRMEQTEQVAASALVAFRRSLELIEAQASDPETWPEFARFDCTACHHELESSAQGAVSWRQRRAETSTPGRPIEARWPMALVGVGLEAADPERAPRRLEELNSLLRAFHEALTARPFGDPNETRESAAKLVRWLEGPVEELRTLTEDATPAGGRRIDESVALQLLIRIARGGSETPLEFDEARQLAWAFRTVYAELIDRVHGASEPEHLESLMDNEVPTRKALARLDQMLGLTLRSGEAGGESNPASNPARTATGPRPLVDAYLKERLARRATYAPEAVQETFQTLLELLPTD